MQLSIDYRLTGTGWAECVVSDERSACKFSISYLSDALFNLLLAANALLSRYSRVCFSFDDEPGEYRWVITSTRINEIEIQVLSFEELERGKPDSEGQLLFRTICLPETFAMAVHVAAGSLLAQYGEAGYLEKWAEHPFPKAQFEDLSRQLGRL